MGQKSQLYTLATGVDVPEGLHLVAGLTGFADAGSAVSRLGSFLTESLESEVVATFDADALLDYRARRPVVYFDQDHLAEFTAEQLTLRLMHDALHRPFLLLTGFEPDFRWEGFAQAVVELIDAFRVRSTVWVHAIPMPVPHTRPIGSTVSGTRRDLIESLSVWRPETQAPANALHLVEYRLCRLEKETTGFVMLVPHYLADTSHPGAVLAALDDISAATGLIFPTDELRDEQQKFVTNIDEQVAGNAELARLVGTLEQRYDNYMNNFGPTTDLPLAADDSELPSAEEIAAEFEQFLARRPRGDDEAS